MRERVPRFLSQTRSALSHCCPRRRKVCTLYTHNTTPCFKRDLAWSSMPPSSRFQAWPWFLVRAATRICVCHLNDA
jgi:hypothetical protein